MEAKLKQAYKTLGIRRDASAADVKKAYHKLALKLHPGDFDIVATRALKFPLS